MYDRLARPLSRPTTRFFETEKQYWCPAVTTSDLYAQFSENKYREIPRQSIVLVYSFSENGILPKHTVDVLLFLFQNAAAGGGRRVW